MRSGSSISTCMWAAWELCQYRAWWRSVISAYPCCGTMAWVNNMNKQMWSKIRHYYWWLDSTWPRTRHGVAGGNRHRSATYWPSNSAYSQQLTFLCHFSPVTHYRAAKTGKWKVKSKRNDTYRNDGAITVLAISTLHAYKDAISKEGWNTFPGIKFHLSSVRLKRCHRIISTLWNAAIVKRWERKPARVLLCRNERVGLGWIFLQSNR